jgi:integrase
MARTVNRLSALKVARTSKPGLYADGLNLYLRVGPTGSKSWVFRFRRPDGLHDLGLGPVHSVTLAEARAKALDLRRQRLDGIDPLEAKRAAKTASRIKGARAMTFAECAEAYVKAHRAGWRSARHVAQWPQTLEDYVYPIFGSLPVQAIDTGLVMQALEPIWTEKPETATRVRGRVENVLDWATTSGYRKGENPGRWRGHLENLLPKKTRVHRVKHHAALPYSEIGAFMRELQARVELSARCLEFMILTAARSGEAFGATWSEMSFAERMWVIPADRMKADREHRVALSAPAVAIIERLAEFRSGDLIFPGRTGEPFASATMPRLLERVGHADLTAHGFRSTFRDWAAECTNFPREVVEMALAHAIESAVEAAYRRGDLFEKRRQLMDAWARYCTESGLARLSR